MGVTDIPQSTCVLSGTSRIHLFPANLGDSGNSAGNFGGSAVRRPVGYDSAATMSKLVALLPNYMQIVQNWSEKGVVELGLKSQVSDQQQLSPRPCDWMWYSHRDRSGGGESRSTPTRRQESQERRSAGQELKRSAW